MFIEITQLIVSIFLSVITAWYAYNTHRQLKIMQDTNEKTINNNLLINCYSKIKFYDNQFLERNENSGNINYGKVLIKESDKTLHLYRFILQLQDLKEIPLKSARISKMTIAYGDDYKNKIVYKEIDDTYTEVETVKDDVTGIEKSTYYFPLTMKSDENVNNLIFNEKNIKLILEDLYVKNIFNVVVSGSYTLVISRANGPSSVEDWKNMYNLMNPYYHYHSVFYDKNKEQ